MLRVEDAGVPGGAPTGMQGTDLHQKCLSPGESLCKVSSMPPSQERIMKMDSRFSFTVAAGAAAFLALHAFVRGEDVALKGAEPGKWTMDFEAAQKLASEKNLPLLLKFTGSDYCEGCKTLEEQVFSKPAWKEYATANLLTVTVDFPQNKALVPQEFADRNRKLKESLHVEGFPVSVIVESDGTTELGRLEGEEFSPETLIKEITDILRYRPANIQAKVAELGSERGKEYLAAIDNIRKAEKALMDWKGTNPKRSPENDAKYKTLLQDIMETQLEPKVIELGPEKGKELRTGFQAALKELSQAQEALEKWAASSPEQNAENDKKYEAFLEKIEAAKAKVAAF